MVKVFPNWEWGVSRSSAIFGVSCFRKSTPYRKNWRPPCQRARCRGNDKAACVPGLRREWCRASPVMLPPTKDLAPRWCGFSEPPVAVARGLRHLPGLVFLDSSCSDEGQSIRTDAGLSLVAARPRQVLKGAIGNREDSARAPGGARSGVPPVRRLPRFWFSLRGMDWGGRLRGGFHVRLLPGDPDL